MQKLICILSLTILWISFISCQSEKKDVLEQVKIFEVDSTLIVTDLKATGFTYHVGMPGYWKQKQDMAIWYMAEEEGPLYKRMIMIDNFPLADSSQIVKWIEEKGGEIQKSWYTQDRKESYFNVKSKHNGLYFTCSTTKKKFWVEFEYYENDTVNHITISKFSTNRSIAEPVSTTDTVFIQE